MTYHPLDKKYEVCNGYFYVYKSVNKLKNYQEVEAHFLKKQNNLTFIKLAYEEMYYQLMDSGNTGDFGRFLQSKGIIKNPSNIWKLLEAKLSITRKRVLADKWENVAFQVIEAYKEFQHGNGNDVGSINV